MSKSKERNGANNFCLYIARLSTIVWQRCAWGLNTAPINLALSCKTYANVRLNNMYILIFLLYFRLVWIHCFCEFILAMPRIGEVLDWQVMLWNPLRQCIFKIPIGIEQWVLTHVRMVWWLPVLYFEDHYGCHRSNHTFKDYIRFLQRSTHCSECTAASTMPPPVQQSTAYK